MHGRTALHALGARVGLARRRCCICDTSCSTPSAAAPAKCPMAPSALPPGVACPCGAGAQPLPRPPAVLAGSSTERCLWHCDTAASPSAAPTACCVGHSHVACFVRVGTVQCHSVKNDVELHTRMNPFLEKYTRYTSAQTIHQNLMYSTQMRRYTSYTFTRTWNHMGVYYTSKADV